MATSNLSLSDQVVAIRSREDLAAFVRDLARDHQARPDEWENLSLESYLEALAAWVEDMDGYYRNRGETPPACPNWQTLGEILLAAKVYE